MLGNRTNYSGGKIGITEKNEKRCIVRQFFHTPASVGLVFSGIFGVNETISYGVTEFIKTREIKELSTVVHCKELLSSIWEYLQ